MSSKFLPWQHLLNTRNMCCHLNLAQRIIFACLSEFYLGLSSSARCKLHLFLRANRFYWCCRSSHLPSLSTCLFHQASRPVIVSFSVVLHEAKRIIRINPVDQSVKLVQSTRQSLDLKFFEFHLRCHFVHQWTNEALTAYVVSPFVKHFVFLVKLYAICRALELDVQHRWSKTTCASVRFPYKLKLEIM